MFRRERFEKQKVLMEVLMHPPYSLDLALSDYHLFDSLQNSLNRVKLASKRPVKITWLGFSPRNTTVMA